MAIDFLTQQKLAQALRARQSNTAARSMETPQWATTTQGAQGGAGVYSQPDQVNVNWAAPLQKLGLSYMSNKQDEKASAAELEAENTRMAAIEEAMQQVPSTGARMDPQTVNTLEQLGVGPAAMGAMQPPALGAVTQAMSNPAGINALLTTGIITEEQAQAALAQVEAQKAAETQAAKDQYLFEQQNKSYAPDSPTAPTSDQQKLDLYRTDPEAYAAIYGDKSKPTPGAGGASGRYDPAREAEVLQSTATQLRDLISADDGSMFGLGQTAAAVTRRVGEQKPGSLIGGVMEAIGTKQESPANAMLRSFGIDATLEQIAKMAPASDTDVRTLMSSKANAFQSKESALAFIELMEKVAQRYAGGQGLTAPPGRNYEELDAAMDALMNSRGAP